MTEPLRDEQGRFVSPREVPRYQITVWDMADGDIVEKLWEATEVDLDEIEKKYADEPDISIQLDELP